MILSCANVKGGVGKSCLAQNIAVALMKKGMSVYLVDGDAQETTADWVEARRENTELEQIRFSKMTGKIRDELLSLEDEFDAVIVDCGGHDSDTMRWAMSASTHVLMPFRPKRRDLKVLPIMSEMLEMITPVNPECKFAAVITQAPTLPSMFQQIFDAKEVCREFEIPVLETVIFNRNTYDYSEEAGSTVIEANQDAKAIDEIQSLIKEFLGV